MNFSSVRNSLIPVIQGFQSQLATKATWIYENTNRAIEQLPTFVQSKECKAGLGFFATLGIGIRVDRSLIKNYNWQSLSVLVSSSWALNALLNSVFKLELNQKTILGFTILSTAIRTSLLLHRLLKEKDALIKAQELKIQELNTIDLDNDNIEFANHTRELENHTRELEDHTRELEDQISELEDQISESENDNEMDIEMPESLKMDDIDYN